MTEHVTVLTDESVSLLLDGRKTGIYIDATLGGGGTSEKILSSIESSGRVIGIDRDPNAIEIASRRLKSYPNFTGVRENFRVLDEILKESGIEAVDGIVADLGISSYQLEDSSRGISFSSVARLDMRMDPEETCPSAYDLLNGLDEKALRDLFITFDEKRWAGRIASRIVYRRREKPIETTAELAQLVVEAIPKRFQSRRIHPATRIFLALRATVNDSLAAIQELLDKSPRLLKPGGTIVMISYHSLEDRIVKRTFKRFSMEPEKYFRIITKKPIIPTDEEIEKNRRSRSAKMRVAKRLEEE